MAGSYLTTKDSTTGWDKQSDVTGVWTSSTDTTRGLRPDGSNGTIWADQNGAGVFGDGFQYDETWSETTHAAAGYTVLATITTPALSTSACYVAVFSGQLKSSVNNKYATLTLYTSPYGGSVYLNNTYQMEYRNKSSEYYFCPPLALAFTIELRLSREGNPVTAYAKEASLMFYRVT